MTFDQAQARIIPSSRHAIYTAITMAKRLKKIRNNKMKSNDTKIVD